MKTLKAILTGIFGSFNNNNSYKQKTKKEEEPVFMTLEEAKLDPTLINEIFSRLNAAKLTLGSSNKYVAGLKYNNHQYYILGTTTEWESFFMVRQCAKNQ